MALDAEPAETNICRENAIKVYYDRDETFEPGTVAVVQAVGADQLGFIDERAFASAQCS